MPVSNGWGELRNVGSFARTKVFWIGAAVVPGARDAARRIGERAIGADVAEADPDPATRVLDHVLLDARVATSQGEENGGGGDVVGAPDSLEVVVANLPTRRSEP